VFHPALRTASYLEDIAPELRPTFAPGSDTYLRIDEFEILPEYRSIVVLGN
jgi:hypothetical protein